MQQEGTEVLLHCTLRGDYTGSVNDLGDNSQLCNTCASNCVFSSASASGFSHCLIRLDIFTESLVRNGDIKLSWEMIAIMSSLFRL